MLQRVLGQSYIRTGEEHLFITMKANQGVSPTRGADKQNEINKNYILIRQIFTALIPPREVGRNKNIQNSEENSAS